MPPSPGRPAPTSDDYLGEAKALIESMRRRGYSCEEAKTIAHPMVTIAPAEYRKVSGSSTNQTNTKR